jgi:hypothetical protein
VPTGRSAVPSPRVARSCFRVRLSHKSRALYESPTTPRTGRPTAPALGQIDVGETLTSARRWTKRRTAVVPDLCDSLACREQRVETRKPSG